jgi:hypothetical protein
MPLRRDPWRPRWPSDMSGGGVRLIGGHVASASVWSRGACEAISLARVLVFSGLAGGTQRTPHDYVALPRLGGEFDTAKGYRFRERRKMRAPETGHAVVAFIHAVGASHVSATILHIAERAHTTVEG